MLLHDVRVLLGALAAEAGEEVDQEGLEHGLQLQASDPRNRPVLDREKPLDAARRVGVDNAVLRIGHAGQNLIGPPASAPCPRAETSTRHYKSPKAELVGPPASKRPRAGCTDG